MLQRKSSINLYKNIHLGSAPEADPFKKISLVKLRYVCSEHSDWLEIFEQPITMLKTSEFSKLSLKYLYRFLPGTCYKKSYFCPNL